MIKKESSPFKLLDETDFVEISLIKKEKFDGAYHEKERQKIINAVYFAKLVEELLDPHMNEDTLVGMEGLSFGSSGNSLIDISMTTALIRAYIIRKINPDNFYVFSPTTIKKFAVKGNAKKDELYRELINKGKEDKRLEEFTGILQENIDLWCRGPKKVSDPCSDLVDATWISLFLEENLEKLLAGTKI